MTESLHLEQVVEMIREQTGRPVALKTLRAHCGSGRLPARKLFGRWVVDKVDLEAYLAESQSRRVMEPIPADTQGNGRLRGRERVSATQRALNEKLLRDLGVLQRLE